MYRIVLCSRKSKIPIVRLRLEEDLCLRLLDCTSEDDVLETDITRHLAPCLPAKFHEGAKPHSLSDTCRVPAAILHFLAPVAPALDLHPAQPCQNEACSFIKPAVQTSEVLIIILDWEKGEILVLVALLALFALIIRRHLRTLVQLRR